VPKESRVARLWIPGPMPCLNDIIEAAKGSGGRGYGYSKMKATWTQAVFWHVKAARITAFERALFSFRWVERDRQRNPDNICAGRKFILDGLVKSGVLVNDGWKQVVAEVGWNDKFEVGAHPGVEVTLTEAPR
jgi:hypothetical protein